MARARNIKPSLYKNELLGVADPMLTILFTSLWCLADKAGRLEDRPLRIKAETFPYRDGVDINGYLTELSRLGFIQRYKVKELAVIQIVNFDKHQNPHHTEKESELPEFTEETMTCQISVEQPLNNGGSPADSLIPDSPKPSTTLSDKSDVNVVSREILEHLNSKAGRKYKAVKANISIITARLKEFTKEELLAVVDDRCKAWAADEKMVHYLRPETLFNATKCAGYVGSLGAAVAANKGRPWYISSTGIEAKAIELKIVQGKDENFAYFKARVYEAAGITNEMIRAANQDFGRKAA